MYHPLVQVRIKCARLVVRAVGYTPIHMPVQDLRVTNQTTTQVYSIGGRLTTKALEGQQAEVGKATARTLGIDTVVSDTPLVQNDLVAGTLTTEELETETLLAPELTAETLSANSTSPTIQADAVTTASLTANSAAASTLTTADQTYTGILVAPNVVNALPSSVTQYTSGSTVVPWPAGVVLACVEATGGGGGGGGLTSGITTSAGGGGSSGYARFWITPDQITQYTGLTVVIGAGGVAGPLNSPGGTGGATTVTLNGTPSQLICTCLGGGGGLTGPNGAVGGTPGAAPTLALVTGTTTAGSPGWNAWFRTSTSPTNMNGGSGGDSVLGTGGYGAATSGSTFNALPGIDGGGGGGSSKDSINGQPAAGGAGKCIIVWYTGF